MASNFSRSASERDFRADRCDRVTLSISIQKQIASIVGDAEDLICDEFEIDRTNWITRELATEEVNLTVKIRYSHPGTRATVTPLRQPSRAHSFARTAACGDARPGRSDLRSRCRCWRRLDLPHRAGEAI